MVEHWTLNQGVLNLILAGVTMLCPSARYIYCREHWLKLRKGLLHPNMTEKLLTGMLNLNTNKQCLG